MTTVGDHTIEQICAAASSMPGDVRTVVRDQVDRFAPLASDYERAALIARSVARLDGLDLIEEFLADPSIDEVMVNRGREVWVDRAGQLARVASLPAGTIDVVLERVLAPLSKRLDRTSPIVDARLADGARLCAVVAPVATDGTTVAIRRHRHRQIGIDAFAPPPVVALLEHIVGQRANMLITGATSTGKTTALAALLALADPEERFVIIEDTAEIVLHHGHAVALEAHPAQRGATAAVTLEDLVKTALRLRPDRLIVGEFRGPEVLAVIEALNTGHDGSLATCHANSAADGLRRVETLVMQASPTWPLAAIRRQVTRSLDVVVHLVRKPDGTRCVAEVAEVIVSGDEPQVRSLIAADEPTGAFRRGRR